MRAFQRSGQSPCARIHRTICQLPLHILFFEQARPFRMEQYLPPEVRLTAHEPPLVFFYILDLTHPPSTQSRGPSKDACLRFSRKELQIGVARYASTKPHACMHAYCTVQVQIRYIALHLFVPKSHTVVPATFACPNHPWTSEIPVFEHIISPIEVVLLATPVYHQRSSTSEICLTNPYAGEHKVYMKRG
jgi:hypothetical protein